MTNKPTWGGSRPGSGRKHGPKKVRLEPPYVLPKTAKAIKKLKGQGKKTFGQLLDEKFN